VDDAVLTVGSSSAIFAHQAARLGLRVAFAGKVGPDVFGEFMVDRLRKVGVETSTIVVDPGVKTGVTVHLVRRTDRAMLTHPGSIAALRPDDVAEALLANTRHVHLGSYFLRWPLAGVARSARHGGALIGDHAVPRHRPSPVERPVLFTASHSGETTETVRAAEAFAERVPGRTLLVGCWPKSKLHQLADVAIVVPEGNEDVIPQTRSFGSMYQQGHHVLGGQADDAELTDALRRLPDLLPAVEEGWAGDTTNRRSELELGRFPGRRTALRSGRRSHPETHGDVPLSHRPLPHTRGAPDLAK
jgi:hypothetical protein